MPAKKESEKKMPLEQRVKRSKGMKRFIDQASDKKLREWKGSSKTPEALLKTARAMDKNRGARYIYVMAASVIPGWYKVGVGNITDRLMKARTWLPCKIRLIAYAVCDTPCEVEYNVHQRFRNKNEWVKTTPSVLINYMQELIGSPMTRGRDLTPPDPLPAPPGTPYPLPPTPGTPSP